MNEVAEKIIKREADKVRAIIAGGKIFGEDVDMNNPDMVIYAAYLCGIFAVSHPNRFEDPIVMEKKDDG